MPCTARLTDADYAAIPAKLARAKRLYSMLGCPALTPELLQLLATETGTKRVIVEAWATFGRLNGLGPDKRPAYDRDAFTAGLQRAA